MPVCNFRPFATYLMYCLAVVLTAFAVGSIPIAPGHYAYAVGVVFNNQSFNGTVNGGAEIQDILSLRLGNWGACYYNDAQFQSGGCINAGPVIGYNVSISIAQDPIVLSFWTGIQLVQIVALLGTGFLLFWQYFKKGYRAEMIAVVSIVIGSIPNFIFFFLVKNRMGAVGESIATSLGSALIFMGVAIVFIGVGAGLRNISYTKAAEKKKKDDSVQYTKVDYTLDAKSSKEMGLQLAAANAVNGAAVEEKNAKVDTDARRRWANIRAKFGY